MSFASGGSPSGLLAAALNTAIGEGVVLVAGTGNFGQSPILQPANHPGVLAVGASKEDETWFQSSNYGEEIDLVAPGEQTVYTNDFDNQIYENFGYTSCATPHVSGIVALMFSANNYLSGEAVRNIIRRTAQKGGEGQIIGTNVINYNQLIDLSIGSRNDYMGYGIPDATACALTAEQFETTPGTLDLHMRNSLSDFGKEPDNVSRIPNNVLWNSPDIWVRNSINPEIYGDQPPVAGTTVYALVRVINKSNRPISYGEAKVKLYWCKLNSTNNWPGHWDGTTQFENCNEEWVSVGGQIGNPNGNDIPAIEPGEQGLVWFFWDVPDPDTFCGIFPYSAENGFSLLARIISDDDPIPIEAETANVWTNARNSNNIAWKNLEVVNGIVSNSFTRSINISNTGNETRSYRLEFKADDNEIGNAIYEEAEITIQMEDDLKLNWESNGSISSNLALTNQKYKVSGNNAIFDNIILDPGDIRYMDVSFNFLTDQLTDKKEFLYHFVQQDNGNDDIISGKSFLIKKGSSNSFDANAGADKEINITESVTLNAESINDPATYNWYDPEGNLIYTGLDLNVSPEITTEYNLEIIKEADGFKDYDNVVVEVNPFLLGSIAPNPTSDLVMVEYIAQEAGSAYLILTELSTNNTYNHILNTNDLETIIDVTSYSSGLYFVTLVCDGNAIDTVLLVIN